MRVRVAVLILSGVLSSHSVSAREVPIRAVVLPDLGARLAPSAGGEPGFGQVLDRVKRLRSTDPGCLVVAGPGCLRSGAVEIDW